MKDNEQPTLLLTIGASASGKTSWVEEQNRLHRGITSALTNLNRDDMRFALFTDDERDWTKYKFNKKNEQKVTECIDRERDYALDEKSDIVVSDTNLNPKIRKKWKEWAFTHNYSYEEKLFPCSWKELTKRNAQREGGLSESLLFSQYKRYMQQFGYFGEHKVEVYQEDPKLDYTIWCDIDGCIAEMVDRKPFDWDKVGQDKPRSAIIDMLAGRAMRTGHITFMSGRDSCCYEDTKQWLEAHVDLPEDVSWDLYMRPEGDWRKDDEIKYELYLKHIKGKYNVDSVFDDRYSVIRMQEVLDLPNIIQVGRYQNEF